MKTLFGGGSTSASSKSGYSALPKALQAGFNGLGEAVGQFTNPNNPGVTDMFTPTPLSGAENSAIANINKGFAPTQESINADMAMQMNPYNDQVIGEINRQGQGQYSVLKQAMDAAGQSGSNRTLLGANDVDLSRQGVIGNFLNNQFNTSMQNALTTLPGGRASDASNQLSVGDMIRKLMMQTKQAPIAALQAGTNMIAPFTAGGTTSSSGSNNNGIFAPISFSDRSLKENIIPLGKENGHNIYEFNYRGEDKKYIGVMADEVQEINPEAVTDINGHMAVNYDMIGVIFREAT